MEHLKKKKREKRSATTQIRVTKVSLSCLLKIGRLEARKGGGDKPFKGVRTHPDLGAVTDSLDTKKKPQEKKESGKQTQTL